MADWHVGQKIVCVSCSILRSPYRWETEPTIGQVYTIRGIRDYPDGLGFTLEEIINPRAKYDEGVMECHFSSYRFRPVVEDKTQFELLVRLGRDAKAPVKEDVE